MNFDKLKERSKDCFAIGLRSLVNFAYGNLIAISRTRQRNFENTGDSDVSKGEMVQSRREAGMAEDHTEEVGHERPLTLTQKGDLFSSLAASCIAQAEEQGIAPGTFDFPLSYEEYIKSRASRIRQQEPRPIEIRELAKTLIVSDAEAKDLLIRGYAKQAGELEADMNMLRISQSDYEPIANEDVFDRFSVNDQHRMMVKVIDSLVYEADRLKNPISQYASPGRANPFVDDLVTKRFLLLDDALEFLKELDAFEHEHRAKLASAISGTGRQLSEVAPSNLRTLEMVKRQRRIDAEERQAERQLHAPTSTPAASTERHIIDQRTPLRH